MNRLTKLARVISDEEARENGYANRHEMYKALDMARPTNGSMGFREKAFSSAGGGALAGAVLGMMPVVGALPGVIGRLSERDVDRELAARNTNNRQSKIEMDNAGSVLGAGIKGLIGGGVLGPLGGLIAGHRMGGSQERLSDKIRLNRMG